MSRRWDDDDIIITLNSKKSTHKHETKKQATALSHAFTQPSRCFSLLLVCICVCVARDKILCAARHGHKTSLSLILFNAYLMVGRVRMCAREQRGWAQQLVLPAWLTAIWINCWRPRRGDQIWFCPTRPRSYAPRAPLLNCCCTQMAWTACK
jgi:hypothetical protein